MDDLRSLIASVLADERLKPIHDLRLVSAAWAEAVGPGLAPRATPTKMRAGELVVAVPEAAWRQEIALLTPEVMARVNEVVGRPIVQRIRLVGGPVGPPEPTPPTATPRRRSRAASAPAVEASAGRQRTADVDRRDEILEAFAALARTRAEHARERPLVRPAAAPRPHPVRNS